MSKPFLIGVAGPSCSGKSELAKYLSVLLSTSILSLDHYYRDLGHLGPADRAVQNFDHPDALDWPLLEQHVALAAEGHLVPVPQYDFAHHTRSDRVEALPSREYLIVEGLFALHDEMVRQRLGLKVFVAAPDDVCLERRLDRDARERGRTPESVLAQYAETVRPMCEQFVLPTRQHADLVVSGVEPLEQSAGRIRHCLRSIRTRQGATSAPHAADSSPDSDAASSGSSSAS